MKFVVLLASAASISSVVAYPDIARRVAESRALKARASSPPTVPFPHYGGVPRAPGTVPFIESEQLVSTSGQYAWIAPLPTDERGPCPGLNAAANHGYLPHDGIATYDTVTHGLFKAYGLGNDSTQFLMETTTFFDGDPLAQKWSIGGFSAKTASLGTLSTMLGQESGICAYGHLKSEGDASITRGDFLAPAGIPNDNCMSYPGFFQELLDLAALRGSPNDISMDILAEHQDNRKKYSIATNPNYFAPVFAGVAFTPAAHSFVAALMSNHSSTKPQGELTVANLMSFFSYSYAADGKTLKYKYGYERIPDDWYKRALTDPWSMADIVAAIAQQCAAFPGTCEIGGNTGTVNSFAGITPGDISSGLYNSSAYTDPAQLGCFLSQNIQAEVPDSLNNVFQGPELQQVLELVTSRLIPTLAASFGSCNGLNDNGAVVGGPPPPPKGKTMKSYYPKYPGAQRNVGPGPRAYSPSP